MLKPSCSSTGLLHQSLLGWGPQGRGVTSGDTRVEGLPLAPGVDLEKDILAHMGFKPIIAKQLKLMDERIFKDKPMNLKKDF